MFDLNRGGWCPPSLYCHTRDSASPRTYPFPPRQHEGHLRRIAAAGVTCAAVLLALAGCGTPPVMGPADPPPSASPSVAQVVVKPQSVSLGVQDTVDLTATALDDQGNAIPDASISWAVGDTSVVSLSHGQAKGKKAGSTTITASSGGKKGHSKVNVKKESGTVTLTLTPQADTLAPGGTVRLDAEVTDGSGQPLSGVSVTWSTSSSSVAAVDSGLVTGESSGSATITAQVQGASADASITVRASSSQQGQVASVRVQPSVDTVQVGSSVQLTATPLDASGNPISGVSVSWSSSATSVATVDDSGKVTGVAQGTATIGATAAGQSGKATVTVVPDPPVTSSPSGALAAFPGAEGWGATALSQCSRTGMQVLHVTNLGDSGPGTLRDALGQARDDVLTVIVFDVAGYIMLGSRIELNHSCLYIAGQTAPGGGITIRAPDIQAILFARHPLHNVVFRYLRFRNGTNQPGLHSASQGMIIGVGNRVVLDHLSFSWANDQLLSIYKYPLSWGPVKSISVQRSLFAEPLRSSPVCYTTKGDVNDPTNGWYAVTHITFHHNVAIDCDHRAPANTAHDVQMINNVAYNYNDFAMAADRKTWADFIGNYMKAGPATPPADSRYGYEFTHEFRFDIPGGWSGSEPIGYVVIGNTDNVNGRAGPSLYLSGNVGPHDPTGSLDQWSMTSKARRDYDAPSPESQYPDVVYGSVGKMPISVAGVELRRPTRSLKHPYRCRCSRPQPRGRPSWRTKTWGTTAG